MLALVAGGLMVLAQTSWRGEPRVQMPALAVLRAAAARPASAADLLGSGAVPLLLALQVRRCVHSWGQASKTDCWSPQAQQPCCPWDTWFGRRAWCYVERAAAGLTLLASCAMLVQAASAVI